MDQWFPSFADELEKIAASVGAAGYRQSRTGRRPIRARTLLEREQNPKEERAEDEGVEDSKEVEGGLGLSDEG